MKNSSTRHAPGSYSQYLEPDFDWISGKKRSALPSAKLRAIPLLGTLVGIVSVLIAKYFIPGLLAGISGELPSTFALTCVGAFLGGGLGQVVYQVLAHRAPGSVDVTEK
ncbi:hypothetical protein WG899_05085 [Paucibacter sp. AS339]|uniref:hypothetical protein n=1 Tax=Paucibacter hankyongi TaxID=3133434 RepID=UPI00309F98B9